MTRPWTPSDLEGIAAELHTRAPRSEVERITAAAHIIARRYPAQETP